MIIAIRPGGVVPPTPVTVTQQVQESFYMNYDGNKTSGICGSVNVGATLQLLDLKVYKDESSFDILHVQVVTNPNNPESIDKGGYVRVKNTNMVSAVNATTRRIDTNSAPATSTTAPTTPAKAAVASVSSAALGANEITVTNQHNSTSIYLVYDKASKKLDQMQGSHLHRGDVVELLDLCVYKDQWNCNVIHIKGVRCHFAGNNGKIGWINLGDTDALAHFNAGTMQVVLPAATANVSIHYLRCSAL